MKRQKGAALVEVAVALPFVVSLFIGLMDFGLYFHQQIYVELGLHDATHAILQDAGVASRPDELLKTAKKAANLANLELKVSREDEFLRVEVVAPIRPLLPGIRYLGYPDRTVSRAYVRIF
ncbi:MAG: pilus assembly protein [Acidobacteria bacterium]|nr:pilus assembly protein [Acidobacteriota bacterium]